MLTVDSQSLPDVIHGFKGIQRLLRLRRRTEEDRVGKDCKSYLNFVLKHLKNLIPQLVTLSVESSSRSQKTKRKAFQCVSFDEVAPKKRRTKVQNPSASTFERLRPDFFGDITNSLLSSSNIWILEKVKAQLNMSGTITRKRYVTLATMVEVLHPERSKNLSITRKALKSADEDAVSSSILRPWIDEDETHSEVKLSMNRLSCLIATFKCMEKSCNFTSSRQDLFSQHLSVHDNQKFAEGHEKCAYCQFMSHNADELITHITESHRHGQYQCAFCFYRSLTLANTETHFEVHHPDESMLMYRCGVDQLPDSQRIQKSKRNLSETVPTLLCKICSESFHSLVKYVSHLESHRSIHLSGVVSCFNCSEIFWVNTIEQHVKACVSFGKLQCVYCVFGCDTLQDYKLQSTSIADSMLPSQALRRSKSASNQVQRKV
jgi:hypothetical protein